MRPNLKPLNTIEAAPAPRPVDLIVIHCSATPNGRWTSTLDIDHWHAQRGFARAPGFRARQNPDLAAIGYHFVLYTNGAIASGRHPDEAGAHAQGHNARSIGVCLVGNDRYTLPQWQALASLCAAMVLRWPTARIVGHRDLPGVKKACPGFDVAEWRASGMAVPADHLLEPLA